MYKVYGVKMGKSVRVNQWEREEWERARAGKLNCQYGVKRGKSIRVNQ